MHHDVERRAGRRRPACQTGGHDGPDRRTIARQDLKRGESQIIPHGVGYRLAGGGRRPEKNPPLVFKKCALGRLAIDGHDVRQDHGVSKVPWRVRSRDALIRRKQREIRRILKVLHKVFQVDS